MFEQHHEKKGGRSKGTPNKSTAEIKEFLSSWLEDNKQDFIEHSFHLGHVNFCRLYMSIVSYVLPKPQQTDDTEDIIKILNTCNEQAIDSISKRIIELNKQNSTENE